MKTETNNQTIDSFPYGENENPLERNKEEFKSDALLFISTWELPFIQAMYPLDSMKCNELKMKFEKFKKELSTEVTNL